MAKKGSKYKCEGYGLVTVVDVTFGCSVCGLTCLGDTMKEVKTNARQQSDQRQC